MAAANALNKELGIVLVRDVNGNVLVAEPLIAWQQNQSSGKKPFTFDQRANKWKKISTRAKAMDDIMKTFQLYTTETKRLTSSPDGETFIQTLLMADGTEQMGIVNGRSEATFQD